MTHDEHKIILDSLIYVIADIAGSDNTEEQLRTIKERLQAIVWYCDENKLIIPVSYTRWNKWYQKQVS